MSHLLLSLDASPGDVVCWDQAKVCGGIRGKEGGLVGIQQAGEKVGAVEEFSKSPGIWK